MKLRDNIEIIDLGLLVNNTFIIADLHIGYEEELNKKGVLVPRIHFSDLKVRLEKILKLWKNKIKSSLKKCEQKVIVINGDLKHEFGTISNQEWGEVLQMLDFLSGHCDKIVLIKGNHDTILGPIASKRNIELVDNLIIGDTLILHGHVLPDKLPDVKTIIIAHDHPCVGLREGNRVEKYKCFLKGKWKRKTLIVQPSLNLLTIGSDVLKEKLLSPFLTNIDKFEVYIVEDKVYDFGLIKDIRKEMGL